MAPAFSVSESLKAYQNGWVDVSTSNQGFTVVDEAVYLEKNISVSITDTLLWMANKIDLELGRRAQDMTMVYTFRFLLHPAMDLLVDYTQQQLVKEGHTPIAVFEMWNFFGTLILKTTLSTSSNMAWKVMEKHVDGFILIESKRFIAILRCLRGYEITGRSPASRDETWLCRSNLLRTLNRLKVVIFERFVSTLLNTKNGVIVFDDELKSSRANDVELKALSDRKSGKEGPVADCVCCSVTNVHFGFRLRVRGETQAANVTSLLNALPNTKHGVRLTFDRGYGKLNFVLDMIKRGFHIATFASTMGSRHPFVPPDKVEKLLKKLRDKGVAPDVIDESLRTIKPWIFSLEDGLGAETKVAKKPLGNGEFVFATVTRELFDKKAESKVLRFFFSTKEDITGNMQDSWIAIKKRQSISNTTLFGHSTPSNRRLLMEQSLLKACNPLTCGQRCANWLLMRTFRITGTMASKLIASNLPLSNHGLNALLEQSFVSWF